MFDYQLAYAEIDDWGYGYIDSKNLKNFLRKHGYLADEGELMAIIRRMDTDGDARVGKEEFIQSLMPEQPYSKALTRQQEKERSKSREGQEFAMGMRHGQRAELSSAFQSLDVMSAGSGSAPLDVDVGKHQMFRKENVGR